MASYVLDVHKPERQMYITLVAFSLKKVESERIDVWKSKNINRQTSMNVI